MSGYDYEVFLSYRWRWDHSKWLKEYFVPKFRVCLHDVVVDKCPGRNPDGLFYDVEKIETGMKFPSELREGIKRARCLVALISPSYFRSPWCLVEWESFKTRSENEGLDLVVPAILHDGASVRAAIGDTIPANFAKYTNEGPGFRKTVKYVTFQRKIEKLAERVGEVVKSAPPWKEGFTVCDPPTTPIAPFPKVSLQRLG